MLGAVHGIEQHCAGLFAEWNHKALLQHAQHVADTLSAEASTSISSDVSPSHAELQTQCPLAAVDSAAPDPLGSPSAQPSGVVGVHSEQLSMEEQYQDSQTREDSHAPQLPSTDSCTHVLQPNSHAEDCLTIASMIDSAAGSMAASEAAEGLAECPLQPSDCQAQQAGSNLAEGAEGMPVRLQAALKGPMSLAKALAVLAAVQTGAASLGLAAGLGRMPWPLYLIGTRDSFTHHLHAEQSRVSLLTPVLHYMHCVPQDVQEMSECALLRLDCHVLASWLVKLHAELLFHFDVIVSC